RRTARRASRAFPRAPRHGAPAWRQATRGVSARFRGMPGTRRGVRRQFGGILVSRALGSLFQAVALVLLARTVTPGVFGVVSVVIAVVGFTLVVTGLGMSIFVPWARARG